MLLITLFGMVKLYKNFSDELATTYYGNRDLHGLREGNRVGLRLDRNGNLSLLMEGLKDWPLGIFLVKITICLW